MLRFASRSSIFSLGVRPSAITSAAAEVETVVGQFSGMQKRFMSGEKPEHEGFVAGESAAVAEDASSAEGAGGNATEGGEEDAGEDALSVALAKVAELEAENDESKKRYLGVLAEMENVRRIAKNDVAKANTYAIQKFAKSLLPVSDNLGRALAAVPEELLAEAPEEFVALHEGILMTEKDLLKVFAGNGIEKFGEVGDIFDPDRFDAMFQYEDPNMEGGKVGQVITEGYLFKDRVLRPCQVGVVKE